MIHVNRGGIRSWAGGQGPVHLLAPVYVAGGALGLLWLALSPADAVPALPVVTLSAMTLVMAASLVWAREAHTNASLSGVIAIGTLLTSAALQVAGDSAPLAIFYLWVAPIAAAIVPPSHTRWHVVLIGASYAGVLAGDGPWSDVELRADAAKWVVVVGAVLVVVAIVRSLIGAAENSAESARRAARRQSVVARLGQQALSERLGTEPLMQAATDALATSLRAEFAEVVELRRHEMVLRASSGWQAGCAATPLEVEGRTLAGFTLASADAVLVEDADEERRFAVPALLREHGVRSGISVVIPGRDGPFGILGVHSTARGHFDAEDATFAESVANVVGAAMEHERAQQELARSALHDPLTGAANRVLFEDRVEAALARAATSDLTSLVAVVCLDLDGFGTVNQAHGHRAGDHLLRQLPSRLAAVAPGATIARLAGDHFGILVEGLTTETAAYEVARVIRRQFDVPFDLPSGPQTLSAGIGLAVGAGGSTSGSGLIRDAEAAMRRAKGKATGGIELFDESMRSQIAAGARLEEQLRDAVRRDELRLLFQPIVALPRGEVTGAEALIRWQHPDRGLIGPGEFIPLAEQSALIVEVGNWVLEAACRQLAQWEPDLDGTAFRLSVNVSARQISADDFAQVMAELLEVTGARPARLALELTESAVADNAAQSSENIRRLQELGVTVLLDDFGTGYASLHRIRQFRFDGIKLDRSFVAGIDESESDAALVAAAVAMGHALDVDVVAEGIETERQVEALTAMGCPHGQGYRFARPVPADTLSNLFLRSSASA